VPLNSLFTRVLAEVDAEDLPSERRATCSTCVMCHPDSWLNRIESVRFDPTSKCCTYIPAIYNWQAGGVLAQDPPTSAHGLRALRARILVGEGVCSIGVMPTVSERAAYDAVVRRGEFGQDPGYVCPYLVKSDGTCGVWQHRNAVCSTWFCAHERGVVGRGLWTSVRVFLQALERDVAVAVARRLGSVDEEIPDAWADDHEGWFVACFRASQEILWDPSAPWVEEGSSLGAQIVARARRAYRSVALPERLIFNPDLLEYPRDGVIYVLARGWAAAEAVPLDHQEMSALLSLVDGSPVADVLERAAAAGLPVDAALLSRLRDFQILVEPGSTVIVEALEPEAPPAFEEGVPEDALPSGGCPPGSVGWLASKVGS
jgi:hypothetical protein